MGWEKWGRGEREEEEAIHLEGNLSGIPLFEPFSKIYSSAEGRTSLESSFFPQGVDLKIRFQYDFPHLSSQHIQFGFQRENTDPPPDF